MRRVPERQEQQERAQPHHDVPVEVDRIDLPDRGPLEILGTVVEPLHNGSSCPCSDPRATRRDRGSGCPPTHRAVPR